LMVAVPTTPYTMEQFEVREVHQDGPSVVLYCRPVQEERASAQEEQAGSQPEIARPLDEPSRLPSARKRSCVHNDYEDLC
jgi:hypothetical protein